MNLDILEMVKNDTYWLGISLNIATFSVMFVKESDRIIGTYTSSVTHCSDTGNKSHFARGSLLHDRSTYIKISHA